MLTLISSVSSIIKLFRRAVLLLALTLVSTMANAQLENLDFEKGTFEHWTGAYGVYFGDFIFEGTSGFDIGSDILNSEYADQTIVESTWNNGYDPIVSSFSLKSPFGGKYIARLGDYFTGGYGGKIEYSIDVTAENPLLSVYYAIFLEDPIDHEPEISPHFAIKILDPDSQVISCTEYLIYGQASATGFTKEPLISPYEGGVDRDIIWKDWTLIGINLEPYIGQKVRVSITTTDCSLGGHLGYAYVDAKCEKPVAENVCITGQQSISAPSGMETYEWHQGDITSPIIGTSRELAVTQADTFRCIITPFSTSVSKCPFILSRFVDPSIKPIPDFTSSSLTYCTGTTVSFFDSSKVDSTQLIKTWDWYFDDNAAVSSDTNPTFSFTNPGIHNVRLVINAQGFCPDTVFKQIEIFPSPTGLNPTVIPSPCDLNKGQITLHIQSGTPAFTFNFLNGPTFTDSVITGLDDTSYVIHVVDAHFCHFQDTVVVPYIGGPLTATYITDSTACGFNSGKMFVQGVGGGTPPYQYGVDAGPVTSITQYTGLARNGHQLMVVDSNLCQLQVPFSIPVISGPIQVNTTTTPAYCEHLDGQMFILNTNGGKAPYRYAVGAGTFTSVTSYTGLDDGTYPITVIDSNLCQFNTNVVVPHVDGPLDAGFTVLPSLCGKANGEVSLYGVVGGTPPYRYALNNPVNFRVSPVFSQLLSQNNYDFYIQDSHQCLLKISTPVPDIPGPMNIKADVIPENCGHADGKIENINPINGTPPFLYSFQGGTPTTGMNYHNLSAGNYRIEVTDSNGCVLKKTFELNERFPVAAFRPLPDAGIAPLPVSFENQCQDVGLNPTYQWDFGQGDTSSRFEPRTNYDSSGYYPVQLIVIDDFGCRDTVVEYVRVDPDINVFAPNAFTPNSDNKNDFFHIKTYNIIDYKVGIYDRWGHVVATLTPDNPNWDGTFQGHQSPIGVYSYVIYTTDIYEQHDRIWGHVTLVR